MVIGADPANAIVKVPEAAPRAVGVNEIVKVMLLFGCTVAGSSVSPEIRNADPLAVTLLTTPGPVPLLAMMKLAVAVLLVLVAGNVIVPPLEMATWLPSRAAARSRSPPPIPT